jgi:hypothetical protein
MKTRNMILSCVTILLLVFSSCREITVTTKVNSDGTFTRIITVKGDSTDDFRSDLPFPVDETWTGMFSRDTSDTTKFIQTYTKSFRNSDELNTEIKSDTSWHRNLERNISVTKQFHFFFSYLTFREEYKSANPFTGLDYRDYLTEEDIRWYTEMKIPVTPTDSVRVKAAEDKVTIYLIESALSEVESIMRDGIKRLNNPELNNTDISDYHDSIYKNFENWDFKEGDDFISLYRKWSGKEAFSLLNDLEPPIFDGFAKKMATLGKLLQIEGYTEEVEMPGLITGTNSVMLNGNRVKWEFQANCVLIRNYEMYVESRVINYWAFILAGVVLLTLVVLLVVKAVGR